MEKSKLIMQPLNNFQASKIICYVWQVTIHEEIICIDQQM